MKSEPRLAFVLDALPSLGGAEKVLFTALELYPHADVFTLIYNQKFFGATPLAHRNIHTSYLDTLPFAQKHHRLFLPLMPRAIESFDLCSYDGIVSFTYAVAHGIYNPNHIPHLAYTYTPMRYAWTDLNLNGTRTRKNFAINYLIDTFRKWDIKAAANIHKLAAISQAVAQRIKYAWKRDSQLIYPPVEIERFHPNSQRENYYVTVSRLVPHKRIDLLVTAFSKLKLPLLIIGDGPELAHLKSLADSNIQFLGYLPDSRTEEILSQARGFVCAAEEDFGIAIVEAQAAGCPVITFGSGGALETVVEDCTGLFFAEQSIESLIEAIQRFESHYACFNATEISQSTKRFGKERFFGEFRNFVESHI